MRTRTRNSWKKFRFAGSWLKLAALAIGCGPGGPLAAGPYSAHNETGHAVDPAISSDSPLFADWAATVVSYNPAPGVSPSFADPGKALGPYNNSLVSLGDLSSTQIADGVLPGSITLGFTTPFRNRTGFDFAVFENGFTYGAGLFAELAFVEVSTNGTDFARFPSVSTNTGPVLGSGAFSGWDMTNVHNLAGKHQGGLGTQFDLSDLQSDPLVVDGLVDLSAIGFVRLVDIPGSGDYPDSQGNPILDAWPTTGTGGLDLRAVGVIPEPEAAGLLLGLAALGCSAARRGARTRSGAFRPGR
ncbi:MAG: PEP-CTERM sorting domain-containing protein [Puniceicoccaceae bacterium]